MPDPVIMLTSMFAAALTAAAIVALPRIARRPAWSGVALVLGLAAGLAVGWWRLGQTLHWPPTEDRDRLIFVVFPMLLAIELAAAGLAGIRRWVWIPRLLLTAAAAPILLRGSAYLTELSGPGSRLWSASTIAVNLAGSAIIFAGVWRLTSLLAKRTRSRAPAWMLAGVNLGAAPTVMLSAYASGGQLAIPIAGALAGALMAALLLPDLDCDPAISVGTTGVVSMAIVGLCFGELKLLHAALLVLAPLLAWVPEIPLATRLPAWLRNAGGITLAAIPVVVGLALAQADFVAASGPDTGGETEPLIDYSDYYGK